MAAEDNLEMFRRVMDEGFSKGNLGALDEVMSPDFIENEAGPGEGRGLEGVKDIVRTLRSAFPDLQATVEDSFAAGDKICARVTFRGTNTGEFQGMPATGRKAVWGAIDICRFADARMAEHWGLIDRLGLLEQLGAVPSHSQ
jgi:predicted ester cyclase